MSSQLTTIGEEWLSKTNPDGASLTVGLYNDSTDAAGKTTDLGDLTTEPTGSAYSRQSDTFTPAENGGNWGNVTTNQLTYDVSDSSQTVDAYFIVANFTSTEAGDGGATDHIIATGLLEQSRDLSQIDTLNENAGTIGWKVS